MAWHDTDRRRLQAVPRRISHALPRDGAPSKHPAQAPRAHARIFLDILQRRAAAGTLGLMAVADLPIRADLIAILQAAGCRTVADFLVVPDARLFAVPGCRRSHLTTLAGLREAFGTLLAENREAGHHDRAA